MSLELSEKSNDNHFGKSYMGNNEQQSDFGTKLLILKTMKMHQRYAKTNHRLVLDADNLLIRYFISPIVNFKTLLISQKTCSDLFKLV